jgi:hypothetical protein
VALLGSARVDGDDRAAQRGAELPDGLLPGSGQHPLLYLAGGLGVEGYDGLGEPAGVQVGNLPALEQPQGGREPVDQRAGDREPIRRLPRREPQRGRDLFFGVVDRLLTGPIQRDPVQAGQDPLLGRGQPGEVPFQRDEQVDPPGRVEPARVDGGQR